MWNFELKMVKEKVSLTQNFGREQKKIRMRGLIGVPEAGFEPAHPEGTTPSR